MFIERLLSEAKKIGGPRKPLYGVGVNNAPYLIQYTDATGKSLQCPYYRRWCRMLERVYCPKFKARNPSYVLCTLEPAWLSFMSFRAWMETQDWQDKELDKDLLDQGNKHYGPATCLFISKALNRLLCLNGKTRGTYPLGVCQIQLSTKTRFQAQCNFYGKPKYLGLFDTAEAAAEKYKQAKLAYIAELAAKELNPKTKQALLRLH